MIKMTEIGEAGKSMEDIAYDQFGRVIKMATKEQCDTGKFTIKMTEYLYDEFGQVIKQVEVTKDECEDTIKTRITVFTYDKLGNVISKQEQTAGQEPQPALPSKQDMAGLNPQPEPPSILQKVRAFFRRLFGR
jgi:hypothetical protein